MDKYKIFFIGLNNETIILLAGNERLKIIGVNYFPYFETFSINPVDCLFKFVYKLHFKKKFRFFSLKLLSIWNFLYIFSSSLYKSNKIYINLILNENINIIDAEDEICLSDFLKQKRVDLLVINSWGILPNSILKIPKFKTLNIHPSLLPKYRGALPTLWSLKNHDKKSGLTYLILNDFIDDGIILNQYSFDIDFKDDWYSLELKISDILQDTLVFNVLNYLDGKYNPIVPINEMSFTGFYNKYRKIDLLNENSENIYNKIGLYPFLEPFFYCYLELLGRKLFLKRIKYYKKNFKKNKIYPGKIFLKCFLLLLHSKNGILKLYLFRDIKFFDSIFLLFNKINKKI